MKAIICSLALLFMQQGMGPGPGTPHSTGGAAIAFDNASSVNAGTGVTSLTYSLTVGSGTNRLLFVGVRILSLTTPTVTYAGASMTLVASATFNFGADECYLFALVAPTSGANNVVVTVSTSASISSAASSYTGALQSVTMDNSTTNNTAGTTATLTLTTVADNCWTVAFSGGGSGTSISAGAGSTLRSNTGQASGILDSNAPITPPGSTSMVINIAATAKYQASLMVSFTHA